jgi:uncharacterized protein
MDVSMMESAQALNEGDILKLLETECSNVLEGAQVLRDQLRNYEDPPGLRSKLKQIEHQGDEIVHRIFESLNSTFITPFDREDLAGLASGLDSILDMVYASALRMDLYNIRESTKPMVDLAEVIYNSVRELQSAFHFVGDATKRDMVQAETVEVNRLENVADDLMNNAVAGLFESKDPVEIMKLKEIYERLEEATDYCEDVADVLNDIIAKTR